MSLLRIMFSQFYLFSILLLYDSGDMTINNNEQQRRTFNRLMVAAQQQQQQFMPPTMNNKLKIITECGSQMITLHIQFNENALPNRRFSDWIIVGNTMRPECRLKGNGELRYIVQIAVLNDPCATKMITPGIFQNTLRIASFSGLILSDDLNYEFKCVYGQPEITEFRLPQSSSTPSTNFPSTTITTTAAAIGRQQTTQFWNGGNGREVAAATAFVERPFQPMQRLANSNDASFPATFANGASGNGAFAPMLFTGTEHQQQLNSPAANFHVSSPIFNGGGGGGGVNNAAAAAETNNNNNNPSQFFGLEFQGRQNLFDQQPNSNNNNNNRNNGDAALFGGIGNEATAPPRKNVGGMMSSSKNADDDDDEFDVSIQWEQRRNSLSSNVVFGMACLLGIFLLGCVFLAVFYSVKQYQVAKNNQQQQQQHQSSAFAHLGTPDNNSSLSPASEESHVQIRNDWRRASDSNSTAVASNSGIIRSHHTMMDGVSYIHEEDLNLEPIVPQTATATTTIPSIEHHQQQQQRHPMVYNRQQQQQSLLLKSSNYSSSISSASAGAGAADAASSSVLSINTAHYKDAPQQQQHRVLSSHANFTKTINNNNDDDGGSPKVPPPVLFAKNNNNPATIHATQQQQQTTQLNLRHQNPTSDGTAGQKRNEENALHEHDFNAAACRSITEIYRSAEMKLKNMMVEQQDGGEPPADQLRTQQPTTTTNGEGEYSTPKKFEAISAVEQSKQREQLLINCVNKIRGYGTRKLTEQEMLRWRQLVRNDANFQDLVFTCQTIEDFHRLTELSQYRLLFTKLKWTQIVQCIADELLFGGGVEGAESQSQRAANDALNSTIRRSVPIANGTTTTATTTRATAAASETAAIRVPMPNKQNCRQSVIPPPNYAAVADEEKARNYLLTNKFSKRQQQ